MEKEIEEIHQEVFDFLMKYQKKEPDTFFFTLRQINRGNKLEKGYWFLGNDDYIAFSFWKGRDWMNKTPRISFIIGSGGTTSLWLSDKDTDDDIFHPKLISDLDAHDISDGKGYRKHYTSFVNNHYLDDLKKFIETDKKTIDNAIKNDTCIVPGPWLSYADAVYMIEKQDFIKSLNRVKFYQKKKKKNSFYLSGFEIKSFGLIQKVQVLNLPEDNRWIFITGENGAGKTSILKSLAIGLCENIDNEKKIQIDGDFEITINLTDSAEDSYVITKNISSKKLLKKIQGFCSYGPIRLLSESYLDENIFVNKEQIQKSLTYGLFNSIGILRDLQSDYPLMVKPKDHALEVQNILDNLSEIMPHHEFVQIIENELVFYFYDHEKQIGLQGIPYSKLPSGTKNYISLLIDMMVRLQNQQPDVTDMANYRGIVIIDEIDIHLHPKMQVEFIHQLSETFPNIQFIVTTHSPIPLLGAPSDSVFIKISHDYEKGVLAERLDIDISDLLPNSILSSPIFDFENLKPLTHDNSKKLRTENKYSEIIKRDEIRSYLKKVALKLKGNK